MSGEQLQYTQYKLSLAFGGDCQTPITMTSFILMIPEQRLDKEGKLDAKKYCSALLGELKFMNQLSSIHEREEYKKIHTFF